MEVSVGVWVVGEKVWSWREDWGEGEGEGVRVRVRVSARVRVRDRVWVRVSASGIAALRWPGSS